MIDCKSFTKYRGRMQSCKGRDIEKSNEKNNGPVYETTNKNKYKKQHSRWKLLN